MTSPPRDGRSPRTTPDDADVAIDPETDPADAAGPTAASPDLASEETIDAIYEAEHNHQSEAEKAVEGHTDQPDEAGPDSR